MTTTIKEVLVAARALIENIDHWTQGDYATDDCLVGVALTDPNVHCFCAIGAVMKASGCTDDADGTNLVMAPLYEDARDALHRSTAAIFGREGGGIISINDGDLGLTGSEDDAYTAAHANVLRVFDHAIAHAA